MPAGGRLSSTGGRRPPEFLIRWITTPLVLVSGGPKIPNLKARINWRHPLAVPFVALLVLASPLILAYAGLYNLWAFLRQWRRR